MSSAAPYLAQTIEPDEPPSQTAPVPSGRISGTAPPGGGRPRSPVILTPTNTSSNPNATPSDQEEGMPAGCFRNQPSVRSETGLANTQMNHFSGRLVRYLQTIISPHSSSLFVRVPHCRCRHVPFVRLLYGELRSLCKCSLYVDSPSVASE